MSVFDNQLTANNYRAARPRREYWRVERIGPPCDELTKLIAPVRSRTLSVWLDRLSDDSAATLYRVCPASETD